MSRACVVLLAVLGLLEARCNGPSPSVRARSVPQPELSRMEPQVATALGAARENLLGQPESAAAWGNLGSLYDAHSLFDAAEVCYRHAVTLEPKEFRWAYLLAVLRDIRGAGAEELVQLFERALLLDPGYGTIHVRLGDALARHGRNDEARVRLERAIELAPDVAVAQRLLGQVELALGDLDRAAIHLTRAIELEPRDLAAHAALAQLFMRRGETARAQEVAARSTGLKQINVLNDPVYGQWVFERSMSASRAFDRATIRMRDGDYEAAARDLELVIAAGRGNAATHEMLSRAYTALGRTADAERQLEESARKARPGER